MAREKSIEEADRFELIGLQVDEASMNPSSPVHTHT